MRAISILGSVFMTGLALYVVVTFMVAGAIVSPSGSVFQTKSLPLEQAAPEIVQLRPAFRDLAMKAKDLVPLCPRRDDETEPARPRGKVLIWDLEMNDVSEAQGRLPADLRLQTPGDPCTVYLITHHERDWVMTYSQSLFGGGGNGGVHGFRTDLTVCAVDLPSRQPRGRYTIDGKGPPLLIGLQPGVKEIDEDWAGNMKRWIDACVHGPEAQRYELREQPSVRCADEARTVIDQCEVFGSLPRLANLPREVVIWNPQTDRWHPANSRLVNRHPGDGDKPFLMVMVLDDAFVRERTTARLDYRVALVRFPGAEPLGVYGVRGDSWPLPRKPDETWGPTNSMLDPMHFGLVDWANHFCQGERGLPARTLPIAPAASNLAGTDWLKGPGWKKAAK